MIPREEWPDDDETQRWIDEVWHPEVGDCRQELVFIGVDLPEEKMREQLDACLLSDRECEAGQDAWSQFDDPFPEWQLGEPDDEAGADSEPN